MKLTIDTKLVKKFKGDARMAVILATIHRYYQKHKRGLTKMDIVSLTGINDRTVRRKIDKLIKLKLVKGDKMNKIYANNRYYPV